MQIYGRRAENDSDEETPVKVSKGDLFNSETLHDD